MFVMDLHSQGTVGIYTLPRPPELTDGVLLLGLWFGRDGSVALMLHCRKLFLGTKS